MRRYKSEINFKFDQRGVKQTYFHDDVHFVLSVDCVY